MINFDERMADIEFLLKRYTREFRTSLQPYRYNIQKEIDPNYQYNPADQFIRESLIEHVGVLPIFATYFYPYIDESVNLGRALEMLAIHDIGELTLGDENTFTKKNEKAEAESQEALKLLHPRYHNIYLEFEAAKTNDAKYANTIDKIAPDIFDYFVDKNITIERLKHFANLAAHEIIPTIERHKSPHMQWSSFFKGFHKELMQRLKERFS